MLTCAHCHSPNTVHQARAVQRGVLEPSEGLQTPFLQTWPPAAGHRPGCHRPLLQNMPASFDEPRGFSCTWAQALTGDELQRDHTRPAVWVQGLKGYRTLQGSYHTRQRARASSSSWQSPIAGPQKPSCMGAEAMGQMAIDQGADDHGPWGR